MTAHLIVRAEVAEADREAFDDWYRTEHLPDAHRTFGTLKAERGWSDITPGVHIAIYTFTDLEAARRITTSDAIGALIAEFDRVWQGSVTRTREVIGVVQSL
ncbi:MAG: hypothetical protein AAFN27_11250 [Pseudomonadota bacterium]